MPKLLEAPSALRKIRDDANEGKGLPAQEVADNLVKLIREMGIDETDKTYAWILRIEERGTKDRYIIKGLAQIYNKAEDVIADLCKPK